MAGADGGRSGEGIHGAIGETGWGSTGSGTGSRGASSGKGPAPCRERCLWAQALSHRGRRGRKKDFPDAERLRKRLWPRNWSSASCRMGSSVFGARGCAESTS
jgi:hypothetical protein